jgi:hypothetical protein
LKVTVERSRCQGHGQCEVMASTVFMSRTTAPSTRGGTGANCALGAIVLGLIPASYCRRSDAATVLRDTRWPSARGGPTGGYFDDNGPIPW